MGVLPAEGARAQQDRSNGVEAATPPLIWTMGIPSHRSADTGDRPVAILGSPNGVGRREARPVGAATGFYPGRDKAGGSKGQGDRSRARAGTAGARS